MMSNGNRTAADVAELESEVIILRNELAGNKSRIAVLEAENATLKIENARGQQRVREEMTKSTEIETILNMTSSGLVSALQRVKASRQLQKIALRAQQEEELGVGGGDAAFQPRSSPIPPPAPPARPRESEEDRTDRLRGAAERVADRVPRLGGGSRINPDLAAKDSRIPVILYPEDRTAELDEVEQLAGDVVPREQRG